MVAVLDPALTPPRSPARSPSNEVAQRLQHTPFVAEHLQNSPRALTRYSDRYLMKRGSGTFGTGSCHIDCCTSRRAASASSMGGERPVARALERFKDSERRFRGARRLDELEVVGDPTGHAWHGLEVGGVEDADTTTDSSSADSMAGDSLGQAVRMVAVVVAAVAVAAAKMAAAVAVAAEAAGGDDPPTDWMGRGESTAHKANSQSSCLRTYNSTRVGSTRAPHLSRQL